MKLLSYVILFCLFSTVNYSQSLVLDSTFETGNFGTTYTTVSKSLTLPNNKILIAGAFTSYNGSPANRLALLNSNGTLNTEFDTSVGPNGFIFDLSVDNLGRIYVVGDFTSYNNIYRLGIVRLLPDGSVDESFNPGSNFNQCNVRTISVRDDSKVFIGGQFNYEPVSVVYCLNSDGTIDDSFMVTGFGFGTLHDISFQNDNKILILGFFGFDLTFGLARLNSSGGLDSDFMANLSLYGTVKTILETPDGHLLIGGIFKKDFFEQSDYYSLVSLNSDGTYNTNFSEHIFQSSNSIDNVINCIIPFEEGYIVAGLINFYLGFPQKNIFMINEDGSVNSDFDLLNGFTPLQSPILSLSSHSNGIYVGGTFTGFNSSPVTSFAKLSYPSLFGQSFNLIAGLDVFSSDCCFELYSESNLIKDVYVYDITGRQLLFQENISSKNVTLSNDFPKGIYLINASLYSGSLIKKLIYK